MFCEKGYGSGEIVRVRGGCLTPSLLSGCGSSVILNGGDTTLLVTSKVMEDGLSVSWTPQTSIAITVTVRGISMVVYKKA